jgi:hypothetical protein
MIMLGGHGRSAPPLLRLPMSAMLFTGLAFAGPISL